MINLEKERLRRKKEAYHRDGIVEQRLAEHDNIKHVIDMNLDERGEHSDRIDSRDERGEHETVKHFELDSAVQWREREAPESEADDDGVEERVGDGEEQDRADVVEERPIGHEIAGLEDDGWEEEEKKRVRVEHVGFLFG